MLVDLDVSFLKMTPKNCLTPPYRLKGLDCIKIAETLSFKEKVPAILPKKYQLKFTKVPALADSWWLF